MTRAVPQRTMSPASFNTFWRSLVQHIAFKPAAVAAIPAMAMFLLFQACSTGAVVGTFIGAQVYHHGGTLSDTNAAPTVTRGPGFGTWVRSGASLAP